MRTHRSPQSPVRSTVRPRWRPQPSALLALAAILVGAVLAGVSVASATAGASPKDESPPPPAQPAPDLASSPAPLPHLAQAAASPDPELAQAAAQSALWARSDAAGCRWRAPVEAPIVDPFRPPAGPYAPGNRGIEYAVAEGDTIVAVADGRVGFRGPVGGRLYLVVEHQGGLRSTYGPLASIDVLRGAKVTAGQPVATARSGFHLTARIGDHYVDPAPFLDGRCGRPRLVPAGHGT